ncbi:unnamed protein product [Dibothriocephalus latus]|uniref:Biotin carboxylase-like N-terminal domain-containing protein n=1 Tax=Dibothriocephalus latus TaxID=60516 RepID=A0A3P7KYF8_DIBLA|nr:unnamed protein product [Dibothriocephalus latus]
MRSIRSWAYATFRNAEAFFFVCMASPEDIQANAEYIKMANKMVMVPGGSNLNNYANVELIFQTAVANHVDVSEVSLPNYTAAVIANIGFISFLRRNLFCTKKVDNPCFNNFVVTSRLKDVASCDSEVHVLVHRTCC